MHNNNSLITFSIILRMQQFYSFSSSNWRQETQSTWPFSIFRAVKWTTSHTLCNGWKNNSCCTIAGIFEGSNFCDFQTSKIARLYVQILAWSMKIILWSANVEAWECLCIKIEPLDIQYYLSGKHYTVCSELTMMDVSQDPDTILYLSNWRHCTLPCAISNTIFGIA